MYIVHHKSSLAHRSQEKIQSSIDRCDLSKHGCSASRKLECAIANIEKFPSWKWILLLQLLKRYTWWNNKTDVYFWVRLSVFRKVNSCFDTCPLNYVDCLWLQMRIADSYEWKWRFTFELTEFNNRDHSKYEFLISRVYNEANNRSKLFSILVLQVY